MLQEKFLQLYESLKKEIKSNYYSDTITTLFKAIYNECILFLSQNCKRVDLLSKVQGKEYFAFSLKNKLSRAINLELFNPNPQFWNKFLDELKLKNISKFSPKSIQKTLYTTAVAFCACIDLIKTGDQKTPGTFFEYFVAYFFTWKLGVEPINSIQILSIDNEDTKLRTDLVFNLGLKKPKFHVPVKTSTRERAIMLWAHQRLLDGVYGIERFYGTPVLLAETKTDKSKGEVIEICLPDQWRVYQLYIAKLKRVYYLDIPLAYEKLNYVFPPLIVRPFVEFIKEPISNII